MNARAFAEAAYERVTLDGTTIGYRDLGQGPPIVFVHGLLTGGTLWRHVAADLSASYRCVVPDWPLGSHTAPARADADLSPRGVARLVAAFLDALDLRDVTLVANDTGGAIAQLVAAGHPERLGRLVLTPSDTFENFLPPMFRPLQYAARIPGAIHLCVRALGIRPLRRLPIAYGWLAKRPVPPDIADGWLRPAQTCPAVRRDVTRFLRAIDPADTLDAAARLPAFGRPVLLAWATEDRVFPIEHARRLAAVLPYATIAEIDDTFTFVPEDQPRRLARLIREFVAAPHDPEHDREPDDRQPDSSHSSR